LGTPFWYLIFSRGLASLKRGSAIKRTAVTSRREAGDDVPLTNDVK